jgi:hypothetical protein
MRVIDGIVKDYEQHKYLAATKGISPPPPTWTEVGELIEEVVRLRAELTELARKGQAVSVDNVNLRWRLAHDIGEVLCNLPRPLPNILTLGRAAPNAVVIRFVRDITNDEVKAVGEAWVAAGKL